MLLTLLCPTSGHPATYRESLGRGNKQSLFGWKIYAHTCSGSSIGQAHFEDYGGLSRKDEKYLLRTMNEASVDVRGRGSELAAGQGSGKNVGLGARSLILPSLSVWPQVSHFTSLDHSPNL